MAGERIAAAVDRDRLVEWASRAIGTPSDRDEGRRGAQIRLFGGKVPSHVRAQ